MNNIDKYIEGYYEATLTEDQERELKAFLASSSGEDPKYDEIRAVMGFFSVGKTLNAQVKASAPSRFQAPAFLKYTAIAASVVGAFILGLNINISRSDAADTEICYAYVDGQIVTEPTIVMNDVDNTLMELMSGSVDVDGQLSEFFGQ